MSINPKDAVKTHFLTRFLKGLTYQELQAYVYPFAVSIIADISKKALIAMKERRSEDFALILASASPSFYVEEIASVLSFSYCVATQMEEKSGEWHLLEPQCKGVIKRDRVAKLLPDVDWTGSVVYTDHIDDEPLMRAVGRRFWVNSSSTAPNIDNLEVRKVAWY